MGLFKKVKTLDLSKPFSYVISFSGGCPGFSSRGANPIGGAPTYYLAKNFAKSWNHENVKNYLPANVAGGNNKMKGWEFAKVFERSPLISG